MDKINLDEKFALFSDHWRPKAIAALNGQEVKLVKVQGEFPWHRHDHEDEFFMVWSGRFRVEFRDHVVTLGPENAWCAARVEHRTCADQEASILCFRPVDDQRLDTGTAGEEVGEVPDAASNSGGKS